MNGKRYIFDAAAGEFRKYALSAREVLVKAIKYLAAASALAVLWYVLFALLVNTDTEKRLKAENRLYKEQWTGIREDQQLLSAVVTALEYRDDAIYHGIFLSGVPSAPQMTDELSSDEISDAQVASVTSRKLSSALDGAAKVDRNFRKISEIIMKEGATLPPLTAPVEGFDVAAAGASIGDKMSPFLKMEVAHKGLDIIAPTGSKVIAAADGVVESVSRSGMGEGNVVTISHAGAYLTRYAHLGTMAVKKGDKVRRGQPIGTIGLSGLSFAPHLHYEVLRDTLLCNPVNHMFVSVTPEEYVYLERIASSTGQSLD